MALYWNFKYLVRVVCDYVTVNLPWCFSPKEFSRITVFPVISNEAIAVGDVAHFNCSGVGSFIRIKWIFNNTLTCNRENCDPDFLSYHENSFTIPGNNNIRIDSTLSIDTTQLNHQQELYNIECRVEQTFPLDLNLHGITHTFFTNIRVDFSTGKCVILYTSCTLSC